MIQEKKKLLVVAMPFSIHVVRWLEMIKDEGWEIHFFSSFPYARPHSALSGIIYYDHFYNYPGNQDKITLTNFSGRRFFVQNTFLGKWVGKGFRFLGLQKSYESYFERVVRKVKPDVIHSMESQHAGYLVSSYYRRGEVQYKPVWIHSTWGLDIDYFQHFSNHLQKLKLMFADIDIFVSEGKRDIQYAKRLGFDKAITVFPCVAGGYKLEKYNQRSVKPSERKKILIKGYQDSVRRGLFSLTALVNCKDVLEGYELIVFSPMNEVSDYVQYINSKHGLSIKFYEDGSYDEWIASLADTRVLITNNLSDGNPSTLFECMLMGVFPIQSEASCADEWLVHGKTGFIVPPEDIPAIEDAIRAALTNDEMVDKAAEANYEKASTGMNFPVIQKKAIDLYNSAFEKKHSNEFRTPA